MPLSMNSKVFITCAITGSGSSQDRSPHVPRSPKEIAESAIAAAKAGAAIVSSKAFFFENMIVPINCSSASQTSRPSRSLDFFSD